MALIEIDDFPSELHLHKVGWDFPAGKLILPWFSFNIAIENLAVNWLATLQ